MDCAHRYRLPAEAGKRRIPQKIARAEKRGIRAAELLYCRKIAVDQRGGLGIEDFEFDICLLVNKTGNNPALAGNYLLVRNHREAACYELPREQTQSR